MEADLILQDSCCWAYWWPRLWLLFATAGTSRPLSLWSFSQVWFRVHSASERLPTNRTPMTSQAPCCSLSAWWRWLQLRSEPRSYAVRRAPANHQVDAAFGIDKKKMTMAENFSQSASARKDAISMIVVGTVVCGIVVAIAAFLNKGTPPPKFFFIAGGIYAVLLAISIRGIATGGWWHYQISEGRIRVKVPNQDEAMIDLAVDEVVGIHKRLGKKNQSYFLVDRDGEKHKVPEHNHMHTGLLAALREMSAGLEETQEKKRD